MDFLKPIRSEHDYEEALRQIEKIFDAEPGTEAGDRAELLTILISHYEDKHHGIAPPDPIDAIRFRMEQCGINQEQAARILEISSGRMSEVMSGSRALTVQLLRKLKTRLSVPADSLLPDEDPIPRHLADAAFRRSRKPSSA